MCFGPVTSGKGGLLTGPPQRGICQGPLDPEKQSKPEGGGIPLPGWLSCIVLLLHWDKPTMATILAPRLERRFFVDDRLAESGLLPRLFSRLYISPLMLELRTTFLPEDALASPFSMVTWGDLRGLWPAGRGCNTRESGRVSGRPRKGTNDHGEARCVK